MLQYESIESPSWNKIIKRILHRRPIESSKGERCDREMEEFFEMSQRLISRLSIENILSNVVELPGRDKRDERKKDSGTGVG